MFHLVEALAASPIWIGACGFGIIVLPIMGIAFIHNKEKNQSWNMLNPEILSTNLGIDFEVSNLIFEAEKKHGYKVHMVIEPVFDSKTNKQYG